MKSHKCWICTCLSESNSQCCKRWARRQCRRQDITRPKVWGDEGRRLLSLRMAKHASQRCTYRLFTTEELDIESEWVQRHVDDNVNVYNFHKSAMNAYQAFHRLRGDASPLSVRQSKLFMPMPLIHPLLRNKCNSDEHKVNIFKNQIKNFRPNMTIFEIDAAKNGNKRPESLTHKRALRHGHIEKVPTQN